MFKTKASTESGALAYAEIQLTLARAIHFLPFLAGAFGLAGAFAGAFSPPVGADPPAEAGAVFGVFPPTGVFGGAVDVASSVLILTSGAFTSALKTLYNSSGL